MSVDLLSLGLAFCVLVGLIAIPLAYWVFKGMALERARLVYLRWLEELRERPQDDELREQTLWFGRQYIDIARRFQRTGKQPVFDEFALMNDVNTASGPSGRRSDVPIELRLERLRNLLQQGLITEVEYQQQRQRILNEI